MSALTHLIGGQMRMVVTAANQQNSGRNGSARRSWKGVILGAAAAVAMFAGSTAAQAQCTGTFVGGTHPFSAAAGSGGAAVGALASVFSSMNTAFNAQGSAFVASPIAPKDETGGGVWVRGIGGKVDTKSFSQATPVDPGTSGSVDCNIKVHQTYEGVQVGADIGKLNIDGLGGNFHFGVTAGTGHADFRETKLGQFHGNVDAPFIGLYSVYTNGNFFSDFLARYNTFSASLSEPSLLGLFNQRLDARGFSFQGGLGYRFDIPNSNWFIEPSATFIYSRTEVDPLNVGGNFPFQVPATTFEGTISIDDVISELGRVGARVGTSFQVANLALQPFAGASVWHEFKDQNSASVLTPFTDEHTKLTSTNVGTFGQYTAGIAGQLVGTGWLGYVRFDYRYGDDIDAWGLNGGLRLQFIPEQLVAAGKMPVKARPTDRVAYNWGGFYAGGFGGAAFGNTPWTFLNGDLHANPATVGFPGTLNGVSHPREQGLLLGGDIGFNYQVSRLILGLEGDIAWSNQRGSAACPTSLNYQTSQVANNIIVYPGLNPALEPSFFQCNDVRSNPIVTATGRVGYTWDKLMLFAKGGPAWSHNTYSITFISPPATLSPFIAQNRTASADFAGWTVGVGFELGLTPNWSTKVEYDYVDLGTKTLLFAFPAQGVAPSQNATVSIWDQEHLFKVGLNYRIPETAMIAH